MSKDYVGLPPNQTQTLGYAHAQQQYATPPIPDDIPDDTVTSLGNSLHQSISDLYEAIEWLERELAPVYTPSPVTAKAAGETIAPPAVAQLRMLNALVQDARERILAVRNGLRV
jgi:hypothetical protein